MNDAMIEP